MYEVGIRELRDALSETIARVEGGEIVTVTRHGRAVARVVPVGVPAGLEDLIASGRASWSGRPLRIPHDRVSLSGPGPTTEDYVREGRR